MTQVFALESFLGIKKRLDMKNLLFLLFVILSNIVDAQNMGLKVVYQQEKKIAYIRGLALPREAMVSLIRSAKEEKDKFALEIQDSMSYYYPISGNVFTQNFKNYKKKQSYTILDSDVDQEEPYAAKTDFEVYKWVVDKLKVQTILGYKCFRAESKKGVVAWFAPELKYPDGPINFGGLGGVILKVETKSTIITAVEITTGMHIGFRVPQKFQIISFGKLQQRRALNH